jgi:hypothetical protein
MTLDPSQRLVRLIAPKGTDEANFGTTAYRVADDGTITVPIEAVDGLTRVGGFTLAPVQAADAPIDEIAAALEGDPEV